MPTAARAVVRIGTMLVELERLERAQRSGTFITDFIAATPDGAIIRLPSGVSLQVPAQATTKTITAALGPRIPDLQVPDDAIEHPFSTEPDVQTQWAQLHYALGAYESSMLTEAGVRLLDVARHASSAVVRVVREPDGTAESYPLDLDREIDLGLTDAIAFAPAYGCIGCSLNRA